VDLAAPCAGAGDPACGCVASVPGELCAECSFRGYLEATPNGDVCRCYEDATADPNNARGPCLFIVSAESTLNVSVGYSRGWCDAFCDREMGCFAPPPPFAYGREPAPQITACANPAFGPPPGAVREAVDTLPPMTCNGYGAPDVAIASGNNGSDWAQCGGHGAWDRASYRCVCGNNWALVPLSRDTQWCRVGSAVGRGSRYVLREETTRERLVSRRGLRVGDCEMRDFRAPPPVLTHWGQGDGESDYEV
jgi:hypothetical protein